MSRKVLVVDDSANVRELVGAVLREAGYTVIEAVDGIDGLEKFNENTDLAMAICDINMPRMTGLELVENVQAKGNGVPIVMLTTEGQPALIQRARAAGAKGWIVKPFKANLLVATVNKLVA